MMSPLHALAAHLHSRPLVVSSIVGAALAWPVGGATSWRPAALVGVLAAMAALADLQRRPTRMFRALSLIGLGALAVLAIVQRPTEPLAGLVNACAAILGMAHALGWFGDQRAVRAGRRGAVEPLPLLALLLLAALTPKELGWPGPWLVGALALLMLLVALRSPSVPRGVSGILDALLESPARLLVGSFAAIVLVGSALLMLPIATTAPIAYIDALFTAGSATCVTGLVVLDTPKVFTGFGQAVIAALAQVGGLGIMTFAGAAAIYLGKRLGVRQEVMAAELLGGGHARRDLESTLRTVLRVTLIAEGLGATALAILFMIEGDGFGTALWHGVFTSISAFCNAGFALQSDNLIHYQNDALILIVVSALIIVGGLGPLVVTGLPALRRGRGTLHSRVVLVVTAALLVVPTTLFLALEWSHTLAGMGLADKLVNAWFQSVTLRTAGFNSIDFAAIQPATWTLCILCMFVGGSPGSTAGGIKTTTLGVLVLAVVAAIRGRSEIAAFGRRVPHRTLYEATALTTVALLGALAALAALQVTQDIGLDHALFETISALGTVGVSMGATAKLDDIGKLVIILCMFAGRVGPLSLFIVFAGRARPGRQFPIESLQVG